MLKVVHQDDALAVLLQLGHDRFDYLLGLTHLEVKRVQICGEDADVSRAEISQQFRGVPQGREAKERRFRLAERHANRANALLDLFFGLIRRQFRQIRMRPCVRTNRMPRRSNLLEDFRMPNGMLAYREEYSFSALFRQRLEYGCVLPGHGPSSKVSTTSPSRRKS